ncbi:MAG: cation:proton antiporter [Gemmatimonadetes bacterium]|nr:cation:proton antiporter [Gemmatimonadota bacterium]
MHGDPILLFMVQVVIVLALARILGEVFRRLHQPPLAGEILAGILLGQTVLGHVAPGLFEALFPPDELQYAMFDVAAQIGIFFLLLVVGLEVNVASAWKMRNQTLVVAVTGVVVPLALGTLVSWAMFDAWSEIPGTSRLAFALLVGAGVAITAITVVARLLFDLKIIKSDLGLFLISAMALNELLGWAVLAVVLGLAGASAAGESVTAGGLALTLGGVLVHGAFALTIGRTWTTRAIIWMREKGLPTPAAPLSLVVCLGLIGGILTAALGIHPVFGFLLAGMMAGDPRGLSEHTRSVIEQMVEAIFVPLFFAGICLQVDFVQSFAPITVLIVTALSIGGKFVGAGLGTLMVKMPAADKMPAAIAHIPGGPMGVLLARVGQEAGIIGPEMFVALVVAAIVSALLVGPAFTWRLEKTQTHDVTGYFSSDRLVWDLAAESRHDAIGALATVAAEVPGTPTASSISDAVLEREAAWGTGVGHGIAIPHARLEGLTDPIVVSGICQEGIEWDEIDGKPAHLVFLILTATEDDEDTQLEILAKIARAFSDRDVARRVLDCGTAENAWDCLRGALAETA